MDISVNNTQNKFDITKIEQPDIPGSMAINQQAYYVDVTRSDIYKEANFCLIPPYCLVADREEYIRLAG